MVELSINTVFVGGMGEQKGVLARKRPKIKELANKAHKLRTANPTKCFKIIIIAEKPTETKRSPENWFPFTLITTNVPGHA